MSLLEALIVFMNISNQSYIRTYCLDKFKDNYRLSSTGSELIIPSVFIDDDYKRHMSINIETGLWRCFKTGNVGNFYKLYSILEKCTYRQAYEKFVFESLLHEDDEVEPEKKIEHFDDTSTFEKFDPLKLYDSVLMARASEFVYSRRMESYEFYVAKDGFYKDCLIIPYFNSSGKLFFFQARSLNPDHEPKYLNCRNYKSSHVLYPFEYDSYSPLFITEGAFDCLSLKLLGLNATTTLSCHVSDEQMIQLKDYQGPIVVAFDRDEAGLKGSRKFLYTALRHKREVSWVSPPKNVKDWNEALALNDDAAIKSYVTKNVTELSKLSLALSGL